MSVSRRRYWRPPVSVGDGSHTHNPAQQGLAYSVPRLYGGVWMEWVALRHTPENGAILGCECRVDQLAASGGEPCCVVALRRFKGGAQRGGIRLQTRAAYLPRAP